jgi:hypothetical protein
VERQYDPDTPPVHGDRHRIEQAVLNVMLNAMEAMERGWCVSRCGRWDDAGGTGVPGHGPGIPESEIEKVILPFYSTKPAGTGLGLPLVARVVAAHRGELDIQSEPGVGTTVRIVLPRVGPDDRRGGGMTNARVLILEDDDLLRQVTAERLEREGYTVVAAASLAEARARWTSRRRTWPSWTSSSRTERGRSYWRSSRRSGDTVCVMMSAHATVQSAVGRCGPGRWTTWRSRSASTG